MKARFPILISYEPPRSEAFDLTTQGVLCQSLEPRNMESPQTPTTVDYTW